MALYRRGQVWYADYYVRGKRVQQCTGTRNRREAEKFLALRVSEVERGVYVKPVNVALGELWERYLGYAKAHKRSWVRDVQMFGHLQTFFGSANLADINPLGVEDFQKARLDKGAPGGGNGQTRL